MAGDWIKIRVMLHRDPKVISIADYLSGERRFMDWLTDPVQQHCRETAYEHVTRNVTCHVTVSALAIIWGVARERGKRTDDDLTLTHCGLDSLDEMCGVPCVGDAMGFVGWAEEVRRGDGVTCVRFPNFFLDQEPPSERFREKNAERQRRHREKKQSDESSGTRPGGDVTRHVTVTHREEKRREEKSEDNTPPPPTGGEERKPRAKAQQWDGRIPAALDVPAFAEAWAEWLAYRQERRLSRSQRCLAAQLAFLAPMGPAVAADVIAQSVRNGWQGLFAPKTDRPQAQPKPSIDDIAARVFGGQG